MTKEEAMKLALEALENVQYYGWGQTERDYDARTAAITALREARAEQPAQQEPVAYQDTADKCRLETVPAKGGLLPQRTWVGLTDEELNACWDDLLGTDAFTRQGITRAIEAKLKEKNT